MKFTIKDFIKRFPTDEVCMETIFKMRFGDMEACPCCAVANPKFYRVKTRKCYVCGDCGYQIYPLAGTIMEGTTTELTKWFFAMYLFSVSKNGVSAKELQRSLGVTYKCAWRIGHKIRDLMSETGNDLLKGIVEVDESLIGGKVKGGKRGWGAENKTCLFGMIERDGGVKVSVINERTRESIFQEINKGVAKGTTVYSDEFKAYKTLSTEGYIHDSVVHSKNQWKIDDCHTNSIEGYWSNLKKSILGTHTYVSRKHMHRYLNEFTFRHNNRKGNIFEEMLRQIN